MKHLLIVFHSKTGNTQHLAEAVIRGANSTEVSAVEVRAMRAVEAGPADLLWADALLLGTPENFGYLSGALKDFLDRIYYPCLETTQGRPFAAYIRAGHDGTGTQRALATITTGLRWRQVAPPLVLRGDYQADFADRCRELGMTMAAGLESGVF